MHFKIEKKMKNEFFLSFLGLIDKKKYSYHVLFLMVFVRFSGIVTRRPLVLQLHKTEPGITEYAEFLHKQRERFTDFGM